MTKPDTRIGYQPGRSPRNNVIQYIRDNGDAFPDRAALRWVEADALAAWDGSTTQPLPHRAITYGAFADGMDAMAGGLYDLGVRAGDRVIVFLPMGVLMYTAMFAVQKLGAMAVFLDSWARRAHLGASAACVKPTAMISHRAAFDLVRTMPEFQSLRHAVIAGPGRDAARETQLETLLASATRPPTAAVASEDTALITFTTGSSGAPKGANRTHRFLCAQHEALTEVVPYTPADADMPAFPIFSLNNLASGVTTLLPAVDLAQPSERDAAAMANQILNEPATCATLAPAMLRHLAGFCAAHGLTLPSLRRVVTGGAAISRDNVRAFTAIAPQTDLWVLYGSTEVEPMAHIEARAMLAADTAADADLVDEGVNVGRIHDGLRYKFIRIAREPIALDEQGWTPIELPPGAIGEFIVSGDHVCRDYYNNEEAFQKAKIVDADGCVWHRTGDLARLDEAGNLWIVGRIHNAIERDGQYLFPVRAEVLLNRLPFVERGAFLGMPHPTLGAAAVAVVTLRPDGDDRAAVAREIRRVFQKNGIPLDAVYQVDEIPMDPRHHSKVEYDLLRERIAAAGKEAWLGESNL
jgi:olefin beta-lactone synthetase